MVITSDYSLDLLLSYEDELMVTFCRNQMAQGRGEGQEELLRRQS